MTERDADYDSERETDNVIDWLEGRQRGRRPHDGPDPDPKSPSARIEVEVGDRPEGPKDGQPHDAPGITVIKTDEDDYVERRGGYTVLKPGTKRSG
jgi:hypothetical protein